MFDCLFYKSCVDVVDMVGLDVDDVDESFVIIVIILGAIDVANIVSTGFVLMSC